jgi:hypothetical protein
MGDFINSFAEKFDNLNEILGADVQLVSLVQLGANSN